MLLVTARFDHLCPDDSRKQARGVPVLFAGGVCPAEVFRRLIRCCSAPAATPRQGQRSMRSTVDPGRQARTPSALSHGHPDIARRRWMRRNGGKARQGGRGPRDGPAHDRELLSLCHETEGCRRRFGQIVGALGYQVRTVEALRQVGWKASSSARHKRRRGGTEADQGSRFSGVRRKRHVHQQSAHSQGYRGGRRERKRPGFRTPISMRVGLPPPHSKRRSRKCPGRPAAPKIGPMR